MPRKSASAPCLNTGLSVAASMLCKPLFTMFSRMLKGIWTSCITAALRKAVHEIGGQGHGRYGMWKLIAVAFAPAAGRKFTSTVGTNPTRIGPMNGVGINISGGHGPAGGGIGAGSEVWKSSPMIGSSSFTAGNVSIFGLSSISPPSQMLAAAAAPDGSLPIVIELLLVLISPAMIVALADPFSSPPPLPIWVFSMPPISVNVPVGPSNPWLV